LLAMRCAMNRRASKAENGAGLAVLAHIPADLLKDWAPTFERDPLAALKDCQSECASRAVSQKERRNL
jgi:hypothetical protein